MWGDGDTNSRFPGDRPGAPLSSGERLLGRGSLKGRRLTHRSAGRLPGSSHSGSTPRTRMGINTKLGDLLLRWEELQRQGQAVTAEELCRDCPDLLAELNWHIEALQFMHSVRGTTQLGTEPGVHPAAPNPEAAGLVPSLATQ